MEKPQTAVEWLISQVMYEYEIYTDEEGDFMDKAKIAYYGSHQECTDLSEFVKKALEMEKDQHDLTFARGIMTGYANANGHESVGFKQYFEKTYGK